MLPEGCTCSRIYIYCQSYFHLRNRYNTTYNSKKQVHSNGLTYQITFPFNTHSLWACHSKNKRENTWNEREANKIITWFIIIYSTNQLKSISAALKPKYWNFNGKSIHNIRDKPKKIWIPWLPWRKKNHMKLYIPKSSISPFRNTSNRTCIT